MIRRSAPVLAAVFLVSGCTLGPSADPGIVVSGQVPVPPEQSVAVSTMPIGPGGEGQPAEVLDWADCDTSAGSGITSECAFLKVPLNRADPKGDVYVGLLRLTADGVPPDATPVVVVLDEPGRLPTSDASLLVDQVSPELLAARPLVFMDRRGSGESDALDCLYHDTEEQLRALPPAPGPDVTDTGTYDEFARRFAFDCGDIADPHLTRFNSVGAADDLDSLRASLGLDTLDYLGRGDGATLGTVYLERYPGRTGAIVLDGPQDLRVAAGERATAQALIYERLLDRYAAACLAADCDLGADPRTAVVDLVTSLGSGGSSSPLSGGSVLETLRLLLPDTARWPELNSALGDAVDGNNKALVGLAAEAAGDRRVLAADLAIDCNDTAVRLSGTDLSTAAEAAAAQAPLFGPYLVGRLGLCGGWPAPDAVPAGVTAFTGPPLVIVAGTDDPLAPAAEVASLAGQISSSVTVNRRSSRHGSYPASSCVQQAVDGFLIDGTVPVDGLLCPP